MERAASGGRLTRYNLEAAVAAEHASAPRWEETNWARIAEFYEQLARVHPTPVVQLNRAVALAERDGPRPALDLLDSLDVSSLQLLAGYHLYWAARAEFHARLGEMEAASQARRRAMELAQTEPERRFLAKGVIE